MVNPPRIKNEPHCVSTSPRRDGNRISINNDDVVPVPSKLHPPIGVPQRCGLISSPLDERGTPDGEVWSRRGMELLRSSAFPLCRPRECRVCPGTFSRSMASVVSCSRTPQGRSPFVSFDKRFFERGGLRREEAVVGEKFYSGWVTLPAGNLLAGLA